MARAKKDPRPASEQVAWLSHLPENGGDWGQGITKSVASFEAEADRLQAELDREQAAFDAKRERLSGSIKARRKLALDAAKRAEVESGMLYAEAQIKKAKSQADREAAKAAQISDPAVSGSAAAS